MRAIMNFEHRCSMKCRWCYVPFVRGVPTSSVSGDVLRRLITHGINQITIGGGDPTSYPFWQDLVAQAKRAGLFVHLDTNGIGLRQNNQTAAALFSHVDLLGLPLDGSNSSIHGAMRDNQSHFELVLNKARWVQQLGVATKINTVVTKANVADLRQMSDLVHSLRPHIWSIYEYWPLSVGGLQREKWQLGEGDFDSAIAQLPGSLGETTIEFNSQHARRLTYPIVAHDGSVYIHSVSDVDGFTPIGSAFDEGVLQSAFDFCSGDREAAKFRYQKQS